MESLGGVVIADCFELRFSCVNASNVLCWLGGRGALQRMSSGIFVVTVWGVLAMAIHKFVSVVYLWLISTGVLCCSVVQGDDSWNTYPGREGAGHGKSVVLISGDEEYRSEEALSQLGKILSTRHGFDCVVLYAIDEESGEIAPNDRLQGGICS